MILALLACSATAEDAVALADVDGEADWVTIGGDVVGRSD